MDALTSVLASFQPRGLIERVAALRLDECLALYDETPLMIVRLDAFSNELALGLATHDAAAEKPRARPHHQTLQLSPGILQELREQEAARAQPVLSMPPARPPNADSAISAEFLASSCYVLRLYPRTPPYSRALTIGRSPAHDVVLRHPSVSTLHARLELTPKLRISEAGSRNGTFVNGVPVDALGVVLQPGDHLKLGAVHTTLCTAGALWHAVHGTPAG